MNKNRKTLPKFKTEAEECAYWETHDSSAHIDGSKARNPHIGTALDDLLQEDGILAEVNAVAVLGKRLRD